MAEPEPLADGRFRRYCWRWCLAMLGLGLAAAALALAVDPYFYFGTPQIEGWNRSKPATVERASLAKSYLLPRAAPATLLLGTSKVECGIDPASAALPGGAAPVFNGGVPGTDSRYAYAELRDAIGVAPVRRALLVVEITEFLSPPRPDGHRPPEAFLPDRDRRLHEGIAALLSRDALRDSVTTLLDQRGIPAGLDQQGLLSDEFFNRGIRREGPAALFRQKLPSELAMLGVIDDRLRASPQAGAASTAWIARTIALSREHGIALDIAIAPVHAELLRLIDRKGLWPRIALAKQALVETVEREGRGQVALWDFVRFDRYSTEAVPSPDARAPMRWFWEPNHFRRPLGEKMLQTIYRGSRDFSLRLTSGNLPVTLARDEQARRQDRIAEPDENARLTRQLDALTPGRS